MLCILFGVGALVLGGLFLAPFADNVVEGEKNGY